VPLLPDLDLRHLVLVLPHGQELDRMSFQVWPSGDDDLFVSANTRITDREIMKRMTGLTSNNTTNPAVNASKPIMTDFVMNDSTNENAWASVI
jgi:hypothetical protein